MKIERLLLISGSTATVIFELEEQIFHKMALLVCVPIGMSGMLCVDAAWNHYNPASFFHPADKLAAVITFICQNQPASQVKRFQQSLAIQMSLRFPLESKNRNGFPSPSVTAWTFVVKPPLLRPVSSWYPLF